ncbi:MAG TPA: PLP-dependent aminotransferase family protein [Chthonomonadaceae bacterium]|nr:PLP-dependent aminotransferase family protein [Chthonomonadaceae bacterium]
METPRLHLYEEVAEEIVMLVQQGAFRPGDRLPSVRRLCKQRRISPTTAMEAYRLLEDRGVAEVRPQSGYYVRPETAATRGEPALTRPEVHPGEVSAGQWILRVLRDMRDPSLVPLGAAAPHQDNLPLQALSRALARVGRQEAAACGRYEVSPGSEALRTRIVRLLLASGCVLSPEQIVVTNGCQEAILLSLRAVCRPGDVVAVESPTYFNFLQALEMLGLRTLEIPTCPREGMELAALREALTRHTVRACLLCCNFANPLGSCMPEEKKQELVALLAERRIPLIEDDIYGDLSFSNTRPWAAKAYDKEGLVLLCSSVSKTLAPGYRVGWVAAGRFQEEVERLKMVENIASATLPQLVVAELMASGAYERHLRRTRRLYARQIALLSEAVHRAFPAGTKMTRPQGGFVLWVQCPEAVDALQLYTEALAAGISIAPGPIFSPKLRYRQSIRLHAAHWSPRTEEAIERLGQLAKQMASG